MQDLFEWLHTTKRALGRKWFRRADYLRVHPSVSTATASRDLHAGITDGVLEHRGAPDDGVSVSLKEALAERRDLILAQIGRSW